MNNLKKHAKEQYYSNLEDIVANSSVNDQKTYWKLLKQFLNKNKPLNSIPPLSSSPTSIDQTFAYLDEEKANVLNDYFVSISTLSNSNVTLPQFQSLSNSYIESITVTEKEISDVIQSLISNRAVGEDLISHRVLKNIRNLYQNPFVNCLINLLLNALFQTHGNLQSSCRFLKKGILT